MVMKYFLINKDGTMAYVYEDESCSYCNIIQVEEGKNCFGSASSDKTYEYELNGSLLIQEI